MLLQYGSNPDSQGEPIFYIVVVARRWEINPPTWRRAFKRDAGTCVGTHVIMACGKTTCHNGAFLLSAGGSFTAWTSPEFLAPIGDRNSQGARGIPPKNGERRCSLWQAPSLITLFDMAQSVIQTKPLGGSPRAERAAAKPQVEKKMSQIPPGEPKLIQITPPPANQSQISRPSPALRRLQFLASRHAP